MCVVLLMISVKSLHSKSSPITMTRREVVFVIVNVLTEKTNGESGFWVEIESSFLIPTKPHIPICFFTVTIVLDCCRTKILVLAIFEQLFG